MGWRAGSAVKNVGFSEDLALAWQLAPVCNFRFQGDPTPSQTYIKQNTNAHDKNKIKKNHTFEFLKTYALDFP